MTKVLLVFLLVAPTAHAKVVVFWRPGFPTVRSQPVSRQALDRALNSLHPVYAGLSALKNPHTLAGASLLVLPYGSAFPADAWPAILAYLHHGGNILNLGGTPFYVPVAGPPGSFSRGRPQNSYAVSLGISHSYAAPQKDMARFVWGGSFPSFHPLDLHPQRVYVLVAQGGALHRGLGFMLSSKGARVAAPVTVMDFLGLQPPGAAAMRGDRCVFLNFNPQAGFWSSSAGVQLIHDAAAYAVQGATLLYVEMQNSTVAPGEPPQIVLHFRNILLQRRGRTQQGSVSLALYSGPHLLARRVIPLRGASISRNVIFPAQPQPGLYRIQAIYSLNGKNWQAYQTGFWTRDEALLHSGAALSVGKTYFRKNGKPFLPLGTNYFSTDPYSRGFEGGNAFVWNRDFREMRARGVTFVRTGVWMGRGLITNFLTGGVKERFLRGLEAYLLSAARHHIQINFTFCAFNPQTSFSGPNQSTLMLGPGMNPYTDPVAVRAELDYVLSIVSHFKRVPFLSWDLINEPSFSNPRLPWIGNIPNGDPTEEAAWNKWLKRRYKTVNQLASAWDTTPQALGHWGGVPLPSMADLKLARYGNPGQVRAFDYNLFSQDMFSRWVSQMTSAIRSTGSKQLIDVGQDEGGVINRVLDQFFGGSGVSFTVNHTYWHDDALLWDSVMAKRVGMPALIGETGVQPAWRMDNTWRWDEVTALGLIERKLAMGFAASATGALQWDWGNGDAFGIKRSDGSDKLWENVLSGVGQFALKAAPYATGAQLPRVAIVIPQSLQLSVMNPQAVAAQQSCVRALYYYARTPAYAVGEYQIQLLGHPQLIILPSPWTFSQPAWNAILAAVRAGATLLTSGRFDDGPHFHRTQRQLAIGIDYTPALLAQREARVDWPGGHAWLTYGGEKTNYLMRGVLPSGQTFMEKSLGQGRILYFALPLEMNGRLDSIAEVYRFALASARVQPVYTTTCHDPGILICPTQWRSATLYVLDSESSATRSVSFRDGASGKTFTTAIDPGRAALVLISHSGQVLASYNCH